MLALAILVALALRAMPYNTMDRAAALINILGRQMCVACLVITYILSLTAIIIILRNIAKQYI